GWQAGRQAGRQAARQAGKQAGRQARKAGLEVEYTRWLVKGKRGQERGGGGRVSRMVEHRGPLVVWDGKGRVDMGW
ncbi:hypothetical protein ALC53_01940, partial [Atta colombica]